MLLKLFYILAFFVGLYFCLTQDKIKAFEPFVENLDDKNCPNILIKKGEKYFLQNTKKMLVPGVNPIQFHNLSEYEEFINWQKSQNINCPILFVEYAYNTQGHPVYFVSPNPPLSGSYTSSEFTPQFKKQVCDTVE